MISCQKQTLFEENFAKALAFLDCVCYNRKRIGGL